MTGSIAAELMIARKRAATWILLGIWIALATFFGYILPYVSAPDGPEAMRREQIADLLPGQLVGNMLQGVPFFGGVLVLILGVLTLGSEYGWGTLKTLFTQRPGRIQIVVAKLVALGVVLLAFVIAMFAAAAIASFVVAWREDASVDWPAASLVLRGVAATWLVFAVWAALGVLLAAISRGTALAIGVGILYGLVFEGLIAALFDQVKVLQPLVEGLLRANGYSLAAALGTSASAVRDSGPGAFSGPYVSGTQATLTLVTYLATFTLITAALIRRRDIV
jgi:ABC-type transport system involved in multi-copper enzyme maturation permease subunit